MLKENFSKGITDAIRKNWDLPALTNYKGNTLAYQDVARRIQAIHRIFENKQITKGDKIALIAKNSVNWAVVYLAAVTYGVAIVPILPDFKNDDIHYIIDHSDAALVFAGESFTPELTKENLPHVREIFQIFDFEEGDVFINKEPAVSAKDFHPPEISNAELAVISYTSGTTGFSKGVMLSHNSLIANMRFAWNNMPLEPGDDVVSFLPLAHTYGCAFEFLFPFTLGCHITFLTKSPSPQVIVQAFQEIKPRLILSVPLVIEKIYKKQIIPALEKTSVRIMLKIPLLKNQVHQKIRKKLEGVFGGNFHELIIGGAALNAEVEKFFRKIGFPFTVGYGMTECGPLISYAGWKTSRPFSSGKLVDTLELRIYSPDPYIIPGEILIKGENVMDGYYKNPEATGEAIDEEGWLHTGDLGLTDTEGYIFIKGRSKSMILGPSGQNIYPEEIESLLNNMHGVNESLIVERNEKLQAIVYPDYETIAAENISLEQLHYIMEDHRKKLNDKLPSYINVVKITLTSNEFEKTPKRSIKRFLYS